VPIALLRNPRMPTRRKQDSFDVLSAVFARLPWWAPFLLALLAWFLVPPIGRAVVHQKAWDHVWPMVAGLFALVLALTGIAGQFEKARRRRLLAQVKSLETLQALSWREFEQLCAEAYRSRGYAVSETARGADGGVDLVLRRDSERIFVQCKHYGVRRVDVRPIRELFGVMAAEGATGGIFLCSGSYTSAAERFARGKNLSLVDGPGLLKLVDPVPSSGHRRG
jgi:restriction system protein